jgi:hypothetical protein
VVLRWFNLIGFFMLFLGLLFNEIVFLNVWYGVNFSLIFVAVAYYAIALWLSLWGGARPQEA